MIQQFPTEELYWCVTLDDNSIAYDHNIPEFNAWYDLKEHCSKFCLYIVSMSLVFRSHTVEHEVVNDLPITGWFFSKKAMVYHIGEPTIQAYVVGTLHGDKVFTKTYQTPELIVLDTDVRDKDSCRSKLIEHPVKAVLRPRFSI
jgi:hypothetical protein